MAAELRGALRRALGALVLPLAAMGAAHAQGGAAGEPPTELLTACAACHGPRGQSPFPQHPSLAGQPKLFIENQLVLIREGLREVPTMNVLMKGLTDETLVSLARYFAAQPAPTPAGAGPTEERLVQRGAELSARMRCGTCHLADYRGQQQVPRLAGQNEPYLRAAMTQLRDAPGPGRDTIMAESLRGLSDADLAALAHYLARQRP